MNGTDNADDGVCDIGRSGIGRNRPMFILFITGIIVGRVDVCDAAACDKRSLLCIDTPPITISGSVRTGSVVICREEVAVVVAVASRVVVVSAPVMRHGEFGVHGGGIGPSE